MKIIKQTVELIVDGIITEFSLPKQIEWTSLNISPSPIPNAKPCSITIVLKEAYTKELYDALKILIESDNLQITLKNDAKTNS